MTSVKYFLLAGLAALAACAHEGAAGPAPATAAAEAAQVPLSPEQVRLVQRSLADRGFAVDLTGVLDDRTHAALADFQRARGLPTTGTLNTPTVDALGIDPRDVMPARGAVPDAPHEAVPAPAKDQGQESAPK
jgi:peptidoglycan hydrolase-like protein with peptidoglycan-binding domain